MESWAWTDATTDISKRWSHYTTGGTFGTPGRRTGTRYLKVLHESFPLRHVFSNSQQTWTVHCAVMFTDLSDTTILYLFDAVAGNYQLVLMWDYSTLRMRLLRGFAGTLLATSTGSTIAANTWHHLIWKSLIDNSVGTSELRINGETILTYSGDTQLTANASANSIGFVYGNFHDIYITDGQGSAPYNGIVGDIKVNGLLPTGAGSNSGWTPSAGSNYQNVDEVPPDSDTTYNSATTAGAKDSYATTNPTLTGICRGVGVVSINRKDEGAVREVRNILYDGAQYNGTTATMASSYTLQEDFWQVHPGSSAEFTQAQLNAAEPGVELIT